MATQVTTPVGRIVWGHPTEARKKIDQDTKQPVLRDGQQVFEWAFGLAIPKEEFNSIVWPQMYAEIATAFPGGAPANFSYKFLDADQAVDREGQPYHLREGHAGCIVLTIKTEFQAPAIFKLDPASGQYLQIDGKEVKCGDYVAVGLSLKVNKSENHTRKSSIYVNPQGIEFVGYGEAIIKGPNAATMFGGQQRALPLGATATPQQTMTGATPTQQPMQQPQAAPTQQPMQQPQAAPPQQPMQQPQAAPPQQPMQQPQAAPQPVPGFAQGQPMQQPPAAPPQQPMQQPPAAPQAAPMQQPPAAPQAAPMQQPPAAPQAAPMQQPPAAPGQMPPR